MKWLHEHATILNGFVLIGKGTWCIDRNMRLPLRQTALECTARVFSRDSPGKVAQWTDRPIRES
jgi:hypothetical protein